MGCGRVHFPGWIHLDSDGSLPHVDAVWYAQDGLPLADRTVQYIYNEHFLEHLTIEQAIFFLAECRRVIQPSGVVRIAMPDLTEIVRQYSEQDWSNQPWIQKYGYRFIKTGCEMLNISHPLH